MSAARYLAIEEIEWLHFPVWRERYRQWQAAGAGGRYMVSSHAYRRLRWLQQAKLVRRVVRSARLAIDTYKREPDLFVLTKLGADVLCAKRGYERHQLQFGTPGRRSSLMLEHHVAVSRVYAALRCRIEEKPQLRFASWRSEHDAQRDYDRVSVWLPTMGGDGTRRTEGLQPDGAFFIEHPEGRSLFFVEVEREQPLKKWKEKVWTYEAYHDSSQLRARWDHHTFTLLAVALDAKQQRRLLQATAEALAALYPDAQDRTDAQQRYMVSHMGRAHPTTIGTRWQLLAQSRVVERDGVVPWGVEVETREHALLS